MKDPENLEQVCATGARFCGLYFLQSLSSYVGDKPDEALFSHSGKFSLTRVGVFVNEHFVGKKDDRIGLLDVVQLHGTESPEYCQALVKEGVPCDQSHGPSHLDSMERLEEYYGVVHYFLFDTAGQGSGGTGREV